MLGLGSKYICQDLFSANSEINIAKYYDLMQDSAIYREVNFREHLKYFSNKLLLF